MTDNIRFCSCGNRYKVENTKAEYECVKRYKRCTVCGKRLQTMEIIIKDD